MAIVIEECIRIRGAGYVRPVTIPSVDFKKMDDMLFIRLSTAPSWSTSLFLKAARQSCASTRRPLVHTKIIDDIRALRDARIDEVMNRGQSEGLDIFGNEPESRYREKKKVKDTKAYMPKYVNVDLPSCYGVEGSSVKVWVDGRLKSTPLFIEITPQVVEYIASVCKHQLEECTFRRPPKRKAITHDSDAQDEGTNASDNDAADSDEGAHNDDDTDEDTHGNEQIIEPDDEPLMQLFETPSKNDSSELDCRPSPLSSSPRLSRPSKRGTIIDFFGKPR